MLIMGVDPGTGLKSETGVAVFDPVTLKIELKESLDAGGKKEVDDRIRWIATGFSLCMDKFVPNEISTVYIETFVMRGEGGQTLQKMIGALVGRVPASIRIKHVFNTTVKRVVAKTGKADKEEVAAGVANFFGKNPESLKKIQRLIDMEMWDMLDAFAIAIAGYLEERK